MLYERIEFATLRTVIDCGLGELGIVSVVGAVATRKDRLQPVARCASL